MSQRYEPLEGRARTVTRWLKAGVVVAGIALLSDVMEFALVQRAIAGDLITNNEATANDARQGLVGIVLAVILIGGGISFIRWFKRAYSNLSALGSGRGRFRLGWALWGWIVPLMNLARPKQITNDIWVGSFREPGEQAQQWLNRPVPFFVHAWWILWVASTVAGFAYRQNSATSLEGLQWVVLAGAIGDTCLMIAGVLAIRLVRDVSARQATLAGLTSTDE